MQDLTESKLILTNINIQCPCRKGLDFFFWVTEVFSIGLSLRNDWLTEMLHPVFLGHLPKRARSMWVCVCVWMYECVCVCVCVDECVSVCMWVCVYVSVSVCVYECVYECECVYMSVCVFINVCMYVSVCVYECMSVSVWVCVCVCVYECVSVCMWMCMCIWMYGCECVCMNVWVCVYECMCVSVCVCWVGGDGGSPWKEPLNGSPGCSAGPSAPARRPGAGPLQHLLMFLGKKVRSRPWSQRRTDRDRRELFGGWG